ncbi:MAG: hypothetical protein U0263_06045 [Polyangiaceae bacterium]
MTSTSRVAWVAVAASLGVAFAKPCSAQSPADGASAQVLFDRAKERMAVKDFAEACPLLEESQRLDPGVGTLFQLAVCYEGLGKFASAWTRFKDVASESRAQGQTARADHATARARALEPKLSYLSVDVPEDSRLPGLVVRRSGVEVGRAAWGTAMPVDPGEVELSASAPGYLEWKTRVKPRAGSVPLRVSIPRLLAESDGHIGAAPAATGSAPDRATPARAPAATRSPLPWVLIGVGGAGILVGGVAGALALDEKSTLEDGCKDKKCPPELHDDVDAFDRWRTVSSVGFVVGAVSVASGITWLLLDDGKKSVQVGADFGPGFARVRGRF